MKEGDAVWMNGAGQQHREPLLWRQGEDLPWDSGTTSGSQAYGLPKLDDVDNGAPDLVGLEERCGSSGTCLRVRVLMPTVQRAHADPLSRCLTRPSLRRVPS